MMAQIDRAVELVTQQVASAADEPCAEPRADPWRTNEFDMTPPVAENLNKVLAAVIPPDGVAGGRRRRKVQRSQYRSWDSAHAPAKPPPAQQQRR
jgi:hypothetical protein